MSVYGFANLAWHLDGDAQVIRRLARVSDALVLIECRTKSNDPIDVAVVLGDGWRVWQDLHSPATAGTALALKRGGGVRLRWTAGRVSDMLRIATPGAKLQARYLRSLKVRDEHGPLTLAGAHLPLRSTGQQDEAMGTVRRWWKRTPGAKLLFADGNQPPHFFIARLGAAGGGGPRDDVMVAAWSSRRKRTDARMEWRRCLGLDHHVGIYRA